MSRGKIGVMILFGAGVYSKKYKALLEYLHMDFDYFTDNDSTKWGTTLYGKPVISPKEIAGFSDCRIIISSTHEIAITKQLTEMGIADCVIGLNDLYDMCEEQMRQEKNLKYEIHGKEKIIVDMYEGIGWGGSELWAASLAKGLYSRGIDTILLGGIEQPPLSNVFETLVVRISEEDTIMQMAELFEKNLPFCFINNFAGCAFLAAIIVKKKYPGMVKIVSVIHNDNKSLFDAHMMLQEYIDELFCVSNQIQEHMKAIYKFDTDHYHFREQPIPIENEFIRIWNNKKSLRIGYAARMVRQQKRADLLVDLISSLEEHQVDYIFNIAGEGECVAILVDYISKNNLENKVHLLGRLPKDEMSEFWKQQDVFVNVSEYEGTSLSMLEAMSYGCVPITTDVSGAKEFIEEGVNGFIRPVGDIDGLATCVTQLSMNREQLKSFGSLCREIIQKRCNPEEYIDYWINDIFHL